MKKPSVTELTDMYYSVLGNLELYRSTREKLFAEAAIRMYTQYRKFGGKKIDAKLEKIRLLREERQKKRQMSFFE